MKNYKLTKEEKKKINEAFDLILKDLNQVWNLSSVKSISVGISYDSIYEHFLVLNDKGVYIQVDKINMSLFTDETKLPVAARNRAGELVVSPFIEMKTMLHIIKYYDDIKKELENNIVKNNESKRDILEQVEALKRQYDKEAIIEINMPVQNQQQIKVTRENGKNVGVLDFGDRTIKIVTNGSIILVNKDEEELEKIVAKRK